MSLKKHISLIVLLTLSSQSFFNKATAKVLPLIEFSDGTPMNIEDLVKKYPDGTFTDTFKAYRDDIVLKWRPYFAKDTKSDKEGFYKVSHLFKKARYVDGSVGLEEFIVLVSYPTARAQILNAIEFTQKLLSVENNELVTIQVSRTYKNNAVVDERISLETNKENKKYSFKKENQDANDVVTENIKDKDGKTLKVITYKGLPIDLIN
jgi:hypothetical protein